jgi:hypothetical protein
MKFYFSINYKFYRTKMASNKSLNEINDIDTISERVDLAISEKICEQLFCSYMLEMLKKYW